MTLRMDIESSQERRIADNKQIFQHRTVADGVLSQLITGYFFGSMGQCFYSVMLQRESLGILQQSTQNLNKKYGQSKNKVKQKIKVDWKDGAKRKIDVSLTPKSVVFNWNIPDIFSEYVSFLRAFNTFVYCFLWQFRKYYKNTLGLLCDHSVLL